MLALYFIFPVQKCSLNYISQYILCYSLLALELGGAEGPVGGAAESESRLSHTPSLLENALSQENPVIGGGSSDGNVSHTPWPAAPDITRETRNSLRDNGLVDWCVI